MGMPGLNGTDGQPGQPGPKGEKGPTVYTDGGPPGEDVSQIWLILFARCRACLGAMGSTHVHTLCCMTHACPLQQ